MTKILLSTQSTPIQLRNQKLEDEEWDRERDALTQDK